MNAATMDCGCKNYLQHRYMLKACKHPEYVVRVEARNKPTKAS